jgi:hypothetical protein
MILRNDDALRGIDDFVAEIALATTRVACASTASSAASIAWTTTGASTTRHGRLGQRRDELADSPSRPGDL